MILEGKDQILNRKVSVVVASSRAQPPLGEEFAGAGGQ